MLIWRDDSLNVTELVPIEDIPITHLWKVEEVPGSLVRGYFCIAQGTHNIHKVQLLIPAMCAAEMNRAASSAITQILRHHPDFKDRLPFE